MTSKYLAAAVLLLSTTAAWADNPPVDQCQQISQLTPTDIYAKSQEGITQIQSIGAKLF